MALILGVKQKMNQYSQQYERVKRLFSGLTNKSYSQIDWEDNLWSFFQNCWHLKDWIKNDSTLSQSIRNQIENETKNYKNLMTIADLANRSKHLTLTFKRVNANITGKSVTIHVPCSCPMYILYGFKYKWMHF